MVKELEPRNTREVGAKENLKDLKPEDQFVRSRAATYVFRQGIESVDLDAPMCTVFSSAEERRNTITEVCQCSHRFRCSTRLIWETRQM